MKDFKKILGIFCLGLMAASAFSAKASANNINIAINGRVVEAADQPPVIMNQRTYVPLRVISENLGAGILWLPGSKQVVISTGEAVPAPNRSQGTQTVQIVVDGKELSIPDSYGQPFISETGRTLIPLRVVGEALGCEVDWLEAQRRVDIKKAAPQASHVQIPQIDVSPGQASRGSAPRPGHEDFELIAKLAGYRTNIRLLDNTVMNSRDLLDMDPEEFSREQLDSFKNYQEMLGNYETFVTLPDGIKLDTADLAIRGPAIASARQLRAWIESETPRLRTKMERELNREFIPIPDLADLYISIGKEYGIRGDLAFCQAAKETHYWQFTGSVQPFQNNYAGLWATGSPCTGQEPLNGADPTMAQFEPGVHGIIFATPEAGVEAHIQHLYAYATRDPLPPGKVLCNPRFSLVNRGSATTWQGLNSRWAVPGITYGQSIIHDYWAKSLAY